MKKGKRRGEREALAASLVLEMFWGFNTVRDKTLRKQKQQKRTNIVFKEAWLWSPLSHHSGNATRLIWGKSAEEDSGTA